MNPRLLIVEDEAAQVEAIESACREVAGTEIEFVVARSAAEAINATRDGDFDLAVCDLRIPAEHGVVPADRQHGMDVLDELGRACPGTPVLVLSAVLDVPILQEITEKSRRLDVFGGREWQLVSSHRKLEFSAFVEHIGEMLGEIEALSGVALIDDGSADLSRREVRLLQIFGVRNKCVELRISPLGGGLSGTTTLRAELIGEGGVHRGRVAAKLGALERVTSEAARHQELAALLPPPLVAVMLRSVDAGAGASGAVVYRLAAEHDRSLFDLVSGDPEDAVGVVQRLQEYFAEASTDAPVQDRLVEEIVAGFVSRNQIDTVRYDLGFLDEVGERSIRTTQSMQHGDLHGMNVLVDGDGAPLAIDYADVRLGPAATDPVTLELSVVFHPRAAELRGEWPSEDRARSWPDVEAFVEGSPCPAFIRACRAWALSVSASPEEVLATALGYSLRQLKYDDTPAVIPLAIARSCATQLVS